MYRREFLKSTAAAAAAGLAVGPLRPGRATWAQTRAETLLVVTEYGPNSMGIQGLGANQPTHGPSWNMYDRLLTYGVKTLPDGTPSYDYKVLKPERAERWDVADDGMSVTFHLRPDATFHDGSPVTANDVKWSFDRA